MKKTEKFQKDMQLNYLRGRKQIGEVIYISHMQKVDQLNVKTKIYPTIEG